MPGSDAKDDRLLSSVLPRRKALMWPQHSSHPAQQGVQLLKRGGLPPLDEEPVLRGPIRLDMELNETRLRGTLVMLRGTHGEMTRDLVSRRLVPA